MKTEIRLTGPEAKRINEQANFHARFHETDVGLVIIEPSNTPMVYHIVSALNASHNYPEAQVVIIQSDPHTPNIVNKATVSNGYIQSLHYPPADIHHEKFVTHGFLAYLSGRLRRTDPKQWKDEDLAVLKKEYPDFQPTEPADHITSERSISMGKQPSSLTEQVTVILSPDPQAREIGPDLLREAAADMGLRSEFEDFISDTPSLFMVFNPVTENRPFAQTIADAMPVSRQHDMIKFAINHSLNGHCDGYATIRAGRLIEFIYDPCKNEPEGIDRGSMLATLSENLYRFSGRKDNMLTNEKLVKLVKHYPYGSQCFTPEGSSDGPIAPSRPDCMTVPVAVKNLPILSDDILEVNDEAWVIYHGDVYPCDVEDMPDCPYKDIDTITIRIADGIGLHEVNRTDVFLRKADAGAALRFREYKAMHAYLQEIKTLDDLHRFPLTHVLTGSEPDYAARMAYEIKRMELNP